MYWDLLIRLQQGCAEHAASFPVASFPRGPSRLEIRTRWLRDMICELNDRVLFVMAGQNRLAWEVIDPDWLDESWLEQHPVHGFSRDDADKFLIRCGIV